MADTPRPYQQKVDEFLANYTDQFIPTVITGKGTKESPYTNLGGPETPVPLSKEQLQLERDKMLASSIHPDTFNKVIETMRGERAIPSRDFSNTIEGQKIMRERATAIPHVSTGLGSGERPIDMSMNPETQQFEMAPSHEVGNYPIANAPPEKAIPSLESVWGIKREGNTFTLPGGEGTMTVGPERFFKGGVEVSAGTPGAMSGDQLARDRILRESAAGGSAIPLSGIGESAIPTGRGGEIPGYEMPGEIKSALASIQKVLMQPSGPIYAPSGKMAYAGGYRPHQINAMQDYADTLQKLAGTGAMYQAKMSEIGAEKPYREAMGDYYRRMAGVHEAALPSEAFARYATGTHALSESQRPVAFPPNSAVYQGAKLLGYVPEKPEAIHPIIRDVINKSMMVDPNTGMQTGFDIRGARQKIGFMAPWLKTQGINVPKESYKMTKPEFLGEQKAFLSRLPKKDRAKYSPEYTESLWNEYWGKD